MTAYTGHEQDQASQNSSMDRGEKNLGIPNPIWEVVGNWWLLGKVEELFEDVAPHQMLPMSQ